MPAANLEHPRPKAFKLVNFRGALSAKRSAKTNKRHMQTDVRF